ncbi:hypothetical protein J6S88_04855 [bacterium]|nr:hypothetical protein [bacterium]
MKKILALVLSFIFCFQTLVFAEIFDASVEYTDIRNKTQDEIFTGKTETLEKKDVINMTVSQVLDGSFTVEGDEFFAEVTSDVYGDKGVIVPKGTIAHGAVIQKAEARRLGRNAWIEMDFDYLITPDGREIPIEGHVSTRLNPITETAQIAVQDLGYTVAGGAVGGLFALNLFGLEAAIASHGYTIAAGAAAGGAWGLGMALIRKGHDVLIAPGDEIKVKIKSDVELPVYREEALLQHELFYPGLEIRITNIKHEKDPFDVANTITLNLTISNRSDKILSGLDMALINDYNVTYRPSIFGDTKLMFKRIKPGETVIGSVSFAVDNINRTFWLVFFDTKTRLPLTKISVDNAYKNVSARTKKKNDKVRKKKNYKKQEEDLLEMM